MATGAEVLEPAGQPPLTRKQRLGKLDIGKDERLNPRDFPMPMEPVEGEEVGMEKRQSKVYKKKFASGGSASSRADGIAQRGKTKGTMVMCKGGRAK